MSSAKTTIPTVECKVIGNIDWNGFYKRFYERIKWYISLLTFTYINLMRVGFSLLRKNPSKEFF